MTLSRWLSCLGFTSPSDAMPMLCAFLSRRRIQSPSKKMLFLVQGSRRPDFQQLLSGPEQIGPNK